MNSPEADDKEEKQQDREEEATRGRAHGYGGCIGSSSMRRGLNHFYCNQMKEGTEAGGQKYFLAELGSQGETTIFFFVADLRRWPHRPKDTALTLIIFRRRQQQSPLLPPRDQTWLRCLPCKLITQRATSVCRDTRPPRTPPTSFSLQRTLYAHYFYISDAIFCLKWRVQGWQVSRSRGGERVYFAFEF